MSAIAMLQFTDGERRIERVEFVDGRLPDVLCWSHKLSTVLADVETVSLAEEGLPEIIVLADSTGVHADDTILRFNRELSEARGMAHYYEPFPAPSRVERERVRYETDSELGYNALSLILLALRDWESRHDLRVVVGEADEPHRLHVHVQSETRDQAEVAQLMREIQSAVRNQARLQFRVTALGHDGRCHLHTDCLADHALASLCYAKRWPNGAPAPLNLLGAP